MVVAGGVARCGPRSSRKEALFVSCGHVVSEIFFAKQVRWPHAYKGNDNVCWTVKKILKKVK